MNSFCFLPLISTIFSKEDKRDSDEEHSKELEILHKISKIMQEEELSEVFYKNGDIMLRVKRGSVESTTTQTQQAKKIEIVEEDDGEFEIIRAPRPGTFYRAPAPDESPFVEVGVKVSKGDILCMIEAMKFYNKIHAEFSCEVVQIIAEDTKPVQYNDPLFKVKKTD